MPAATASTATPHEDLTAVGFPLPASAQRWAQRPPPTPRPRRKTATDTSPLDTHWIMMDGRPYFVAGYTSGGVPYGMFEDEMHDLDDLDHDPDGLPSLPDGGLGGPGDAGRTATSRPPETTLRDEASHSARQGRVLDTDRSHVFDIEPDLQST